MSSEVRVQTLSGCEVSGDGQTISLSMSGSGGDTVCIHLTPDQVGSLAMTLPRLLSAALKAQYADPSLRFVFPLAQCDLEQSPGRAEMILSLQSTDGFEVCFCVHPDVLRDLASRSKAKAPLPVH